MLQDGGPDHGCHAGEETCGDLLDGAKIDAGLAKSRIEEDVAEWNENDERERIEIVKDVVWKAIQRHRRGLCDQIVVELVVGDPIQWIPAENRASLETSADLIHKCIVEGHPSWATGWLDVGWLCVLPEHAGG